MKKSLLALAALSAVAGVASAQSSVTLFGVVDLELRSVTNTGGTIKTLSNDGYNSSRLGVRGVEDLGGGLRAQFWLEGGLSADFGNQGGNVGLAAPTNGSSNIWNRRATISLMGGFGEIRLGRDYTPSFWNHTVFDPFGTNGLGSTINIQNTSLGSGAITYVRDNNTVGYFLPELGGVYGQGMIAAGENVGGQKYQGLRVGYAGGPVNVAGAIGKTKKTGTMTDDFSDTNIGGSFKAGPALIQAQWGKEKYAAESQKTIMVGANVTVGAGEIRGSYTKNSGSTANAALAKQYDAKQLAVGYVHNLSKRTALYGTYATINNDGTSATGANFSVNGSNTAPALTRGDTSKGYEFGIRHTF